MATEERPSRLPYRLTTYATLQVHSAAAHPIADSPEGRSHDRSSVFRHLAPPLSSQQLLFLLFSMARSSRDSKAKVRRRFHPCEL